MLYVSTTQVVECLYGISVALGNIIRDRFYSVIQLLFVRSFIHYPTAIQVIVEPWAGK